MLILCNAIQVRLKRYCIKIYSKKILLVEPAVLEIELHFNYGKNVKEQNVYLSISAFSIQIHKITEMITCAYSWKSN